MNRAKAGGLQLTGEGGLLQEYGQAAAGVRAEGEITDLRHDKHDPAGHNTGNSRNGTRNKTVLKDVGPVEITVPRDRNGSFEPKIVAKRQKRPTGVDEMVISLAAKGLTTGEISAHLAEVYGAEVFRQTISTTAGKPVCTAPTQAAVRERFAEVWGARFPAIVRLRDNAWAEFVLFLAFEPEIRRMICSANAIESVNAGVRRAVKARGHLPNGQAALNAFDGRLTAGRK